MKTVERAEYSRYAGLDGLEVMSARWVEHSFAPHMHDFHAISLNYAGRGAFDCRKEVRDAAPGTCNLIGPGVLHTGRSTSVDGWAYRNLYIDPPLMTTLLRSLEWRGPLELEFRAPLVRDSVLAARLARVFASLHETSSLLQRESLLLAVVARLLTDHVVSGHAVDRMGQEHAAVARIRNWLEAHSEENISIQSLSALVGLSPFYLVRVFHKHVGIPRHHYQTVVRVNRAQRLLKSGAAISEVAYRTGFCDQSHLNRLGRVTRLIGVRWPDALGGWSIALAIVATGLLLGGGLVYEMVASAVFREPSTTAAALSALMKPTVPYFISVNTALEALIVPALVYSNWTVPRRRRLTIAGATLYFVMRAWTYLTYAPMRMDLASRPLSAEDIAWYQRTMSVDYRGVLVAAVLVCVVLAALRGSHVPHEESRSR